MNNHWPHAPPHRFLEKGTYMITGSTYEKVHHFRDEQRLSYLTDRLLQTIEGSNWRIQAWSVFSNHYHFIAFSPDDPEKLKKMLQLLHYETASEINKMDGCPGRMVWYNSWDSHITFRQSYMARLNYVHNNPVKHKIVKDAEEYPYCSAHWFRSTADKSFYHSINRFDTSSVNVYDDFDV